MSVQNGEVIVDTDKGKAFEETNDNIKFLSNIMKQNNLNEMIQDELNKDIS